MTKNYDYWKKKHEEEQLEEFSTEPLGLLWLKTKSIIRRDILDAFLSDSKIELKSLLQNLF